MIHWLWDKYANQTHWVHSLALLAVRLWLALIFFKSGLVKISSMESTTALFAYEYAVPILPAAIAAWLATAIELVLPPLLAIGFATRPVAVLLFLFNGIAAVSYPDISAAGLIQHQLWGLALLVAILWGPGRLSLAPMVNSFYLRSHSGVLS